MTREIKFRLRDFEDRIVGYEKWYPGALNKETFLYTAKPQWLYSLDGKYWNSDPINHRFKDESTGLLDCNEKEIYESDIVECLDTKLIHIIISHGCSLGAIRRDLYKSYKDDFGFWIPKEGRYDFKILGNIYENENLLTNIKE